MPFGLTNAPATFMTLTNDIFRDQLDQFVIVYIDDILIYSKTVEKHTKHLCLVLQKLRDHKLYAKPSKCEFYQTQIGFLGHEVSESGVGPEKNKVTAVQEWPAPTAKFASSWDLPTTTGASSPRTLTSRPHLRS